jgi:hypothetical protein
MTWFDIRDKEPPEDLPVLFQDYHTEAYSVGYWNKTEKCMVSRHHIKDLDGWKYIPSRWTFIYDIPVNEAPND